MAEEKTPQHTDKDIPTKEEIMSILKEQIEVKTLQVDLQNLNTQLAKLRAEELQALNFIGQMTDPKRKGDEYQGDGVPHTLTKEDMENNPELAEQGLKEGDEVLIPQEAKRNLKKK